MEKTVKNLLLTAAMPIGRTLYIYGGGWNEADTGAGKEALTAEVSPLWQKFYREHLCSDYDHKKFDYTKNIDLIHSGLDCSGYVGWVLYKLFGSGKHGYVCKSKEVTKNLSSIFPGQFFKSRYITSYMPGDILSGEKTSHVFICIGMCSDGSLLLFHSSPPAPMMSGTYTPDNKPGEAIAIAETFMKEVYPEHFSVFPDISRPSSYTRDYSLFRFDPKILSDPENYRSKTPAEIEKDLKFHIKANKNITADRL